MATFEYYGMNANDDNDTLCSVFDIKTTLPEATFYLYYEDLGVNFSNELYEDYYAYFGYGEKSGNSYKHTVGALTKAPVFEISTNAEFEVFDISANEIDETKTASKIKVNYKFNNDQPLLSGTIIKVYVNDIYVFPIQFHPMTILSFFDYILYSTDLSHETYLIIDDAFNDCSTEIGNTELPANFADATINPVGTKSHLFINYSNSNDINNFTYTSDMNEYVHYEGDDILSNNKQSYSIQITNYILYKSDNDENDKFQFIDNNIMPEHVKLYKSINNGFTFISDLHFQYDDGGSLYYYFV